MSSGDALPVADTEAADDRGAPASDSVTRSEQPLRLTYAVGRFHAVLRHVMVDQLRSRNLTVSEFTALSVLGARSGLSNAQLARRSLVTPQAMNKVLASLESKGLVLRSQASGSDPREHHRARGIQLTAEGRVQLQQATAAIDAIEVAAFYGASASERAVLSACLMDATDRLSTIAPSRGPQRRV